MRERVTHTFNLDLTFVALSDLLKQDSMRSKLTKRDAMRVEYSTVSLELVCVKTSISVLLSASLAMVSVNAPFQFFPLLEYSRSCLIDHNIAIDVLGGRALGCLFLGSALSDFYPGWTH